MQNFHFWSPPVVQKVASLSSLLAKTYRKDKKKNKVRVRNYILQREVILAENELSFKVNIAALHQKLIMYEKQHWLHMCKQILFRMFFAAVRVFICRQLANKSFNEKKEKKGSEPSMCSLMLNSFSNVLV